MRSSPQNGRKSVKRAEQESLFDQLVAAHANRAAPVFRRGKESESSELAKAFWEGYRGENEGVRRTADLAAAWRAGAESRRRRGGRPAAGDAEKRKVRSLRLKDAHYAALKELGMPWLEDQLDRYIVSKQGSAQGAEGETR